MTRAHWLVRAAFHALPEWFRDTAGDDVLLTHELRAREVRGSRLRFILSEAASLVALAVRVHLSPPRTAFAHAN
ncbi:MAG: hypothetical protein ACRDMZ_07925, partial [Solirubrobacteraceae bacterium]